MTTKYGREYGDALNMLLLTLKGTPTTYYGEELGMIDIEVSYEDTQDPFGKNMGPVGGVINKSPLIVLIVE